jgi:hypothetical protein
MVGRIDGYAQVFGLEIGATWRCMSDLAGLVKGLSG